MPKGRGIKKEKYKKQKFEFNMEIFLTHSAPGWLSGRYSCLTGKFKIPAGGRQAC